MVVEPQAVGPLLAVTLSFGVERTVEVEELWSAVVGVQVVGQRSVEALSSVVVVVEMVVSSGEAVVGMRVTEVLSSPMVGEPQFLLVYSSGF